MFSIQELNTIGIRDWNLIKSNYESASILLGNGFSINFSNTLRYKYLYEFFVKSCSAEAQKLFTKFDTKNFEQILENIEIANSVCETLKINHTSFTSINNEIKQGLIDSIHKIHPKPDVISQNQLKFIGQQFKSFNNIFTTNYDLFLYYIILETNSRYGDNFFTSVSPKYNLFIGPDEMNNHHIYYLHGALFLFEEEWATYKIKKPSNGWLLDIITNEISVNKYPLFISEGKSENKLKAIRSNSYLNYCFNKLENNQNKKLIIFGQSLNEQDNHIAKAIDDNYEQISISIRTEDWQSLGELKAEKNRISSLFKKTTFDFFDAKTLFEFNPINQ